MFSLWWNGERFLTGQNHAMSEIFVFLGKVYERENTFWKYRRWIVVYLFVLPYSLASILMIEKKCNCRISWSVGVHVAKTVPGVPVSKMLRVSLPNTPPIQVILVGGSFLLSIRMVKLRDIQRPEKLRDFC